MRNGKERKLLSSSPVQQQQLDCEVGLGLKMQLHSSYSSCDGAAAAGGGVPFFNSSTNQPPQPHLYDHANGVLLHSTASRPYANYGIGGMNMNVMSGMYGGAGMGSSSSLFTRSQLQELERQKLIHKYILANIPVPPQLLLSSQQPPPHSSSSSSLSQCNTTSSGSGMMDMRYGGSGNGSSDPEPWRCKRTDGKKWRCSRDVAGDQKYCERHAHKNRPRSRKHVEPNKLPPSSSSSSTTTNTNTTPPQLIQRSSSQFPYDQTRCIEWLMRGGIGIGNNNSDNTNPLSLSNNNNNNKHQQWEQMMQNSVKINYDDHNDHESVYHPQFAEKQAAAAPYMDDPDSTNQATTRLFIDSWGKNATKGLSVDKKILSSSTLSLSMSSRDHDRDHDDEEKGEDLGIGMMIGMNRHYQQQQQQWVNPISWLNSLSSSSSSGGGASGGGGGGGAPGGPLGEALCLGNGGMNLAASSLPSPQNHGCCYAIANSNSNSNSNTNSSKSSCQDASHALNFIG